MKAGGVRMGAAVDLGLRKAILIYTGDFDEAFATVHDVDTSRATPTLCPGNLLTMTFLAELASALGSRLSPEVLPANVLARTPHLLCWYTPATQRVMYFRRGSELSSLNGMALPVPRLVWRLTGNEMYVRALPLNGERPDAETDLFVAPFWNTNDTGLVCQGSMARPADMAVATMQAWVDAYFDSEFTHAFGALNLTRFKGGFVEMWKSLRRRRDFPPEYLSPAKQTLEQFITGRDAQDSAQVA